MNLPFTGQACARLALMGTAMLLASCGGGDNAGSNTGGTPAATVMASTTLLAGSPNGWGHLDGQGTDAWFSSPSHVATDAQGNVYVADSGNRAIRKISPAGVVNTLAGGTGPLETEAGSGIVILNDDQKDGVGLAARFESPQGVAVNAEGNVFVADQQTIRKITPAGVVTTLAGKARQSGHVNGSGDSARFRRLSGIALGQDGTLYVSDAGTCAIRTI